MNGKGESVDKVITCKQCKHFRPWKNTDEPRGKCELHKRLHYEWWYCGDAIKKGKRLKKDV